MAFSSRFNYSTIMSFSIYFLSQITKTQFPHLSEFRKYRDAEISRRDEYSRRIPNVSELAKIAKIAKKRVFSRFLLFASFGNSVLPKIRVGTSFSSFFRTRSVSRIFVPSRKPTRKFGKKFGMQGLNKNIVCLSTK